MHSTDIIGDIVDEFWGLYMHQICILCFIPFLLYFHATIYYFSLSFAYDLGLTEYGNIEGNQV